MVDPYCFLVEFGAVTGLGGVSFLVAESSRFELRFGFPRDGNGSAHVALAAKLALKILARLEINFGRVLDVSLTRKAKAPDPRVIGREAFFFLFFFAGILFLFFLREEEHSSMEKLSGEP